MNWWKRLKAWQKWGISFALCHFILIGSVYWGNNLKVLEGDIGILIVLIDLPLTLLATTLSLHSDSTVIAVSFYLGGGTLMYSFIGSLIGLIITKLKRP